MSTVKIITDVQLQTHRTANQPMSVVPYVQNHTQDTPTTTTTKINSKCGSPPVHTPVVHKLHQFT
jgi:hypothetical protein